jgi:deazaflavin-dependent oxidoreductase (nitroreductase family)
MQSPSMSESKPNSVGIVERFLVGLATFLKHFITPTNRLLLKISKGRLGNSFLGVPVLLLHTTGAKSGKERVAPLFYLAHEGKYLLVASNGGNAKNPGWVANLKARPDVMVTIRGKRISMRAHFAAPEEHQRYWPLVTKMFPTWEKVQDSSLRTFPIAVLQPHDAGETAPPSVS